MAALAEPGRRGESRYYVSDSVEDFSRLASIFLRQDVAAEVTQVDIWRILRRSPASDQGARFWALHSPPSSI